MGVSRCMGREDQEVRRSIEEGKWAALTAVRPTLAISALDDPIVSGGESRASQHRLNFADCLPYAAVEASTHLVLATVPHGGHLGWFEGSLTGSDHHQRWHVKPVLEFLKGVIDDLVPSTPGVEALKVKEVGGWKWAEGAGWQVVNRSGCKAVE